MQQATWFSGKMFSLLIVCITAVLIFGCKPKSDSNTQSTDADSLITDSVNLMAGPNLRYRYFVLDSQTIAANADKLFPKSEGAMNTIVICKLNFRGVSSGTFLADLVLFADESHGRHGRGKDKFFARDSASLYKTLVDSVIIGNNYLNWEAFRDLIFVRVGNVYQIQQNFGYLLLEPMNTVNAANPAHPVCSKCNGHLWYLIRLFDKNGNPWGGGGGGGEGSTNPSPPAEP